MSARNADAGQGVRRLVGAAWSELPLWLAASALVCAAASAAAWLAPGITPVSALVTTLFLAAPVGALLAMLVDVADGRDVGWSRWSHALTRQGVTAVQDCLPAAGTTALLTVAIDVWQVSGEPLVLVSVGVGGAVSLLGWVVTAARLPLRLDRPDLRGRDGWLVAAGVAAAAPLRHLTAPLLLAAAVWVAVEVAVSVLLLVPFPVALVAVAAYWTTATDLGLTESDESNHVARSLACN